MDKVQMCKIFVTHFNKSGIIEKVKIVGFVTGCFATNIWCHKHNVEYYNNIPIL